MFFRKKGSQAVLMILLVFCFCYTVFGQEYSTIKVGLESVYNNASGIQLSSDGALSIGYYDESGFVQLGTLTTNCITIEKVSGQYSDIGGIYSSYDEAYHAAQTLNGIPVSIEEGLFGVYAVSSTADSMISNSSNGYVVKDMTGKELFLFYKGTKDLTFRGYDVATGMYLTQVGNSKKYRGAIGIGGTTGITPYNVLDMEQYLYGVVPGEMAASWPAEALKAQAVAARSIAIFQYNRHLSKGYNVVDTTITQVYGGYLKEDARTNAAVDATRGETVKYQGKVAEALYFSTSGGATESATNVWGSYTPYLIGVSDHYETEPAQPAWSRQMTLSELDTCLAGQGINIGSAQGIQIVSRTPSGRVQEMKILGTTGSYTLTLEKVRTFFSSTSGGSLKSRLFSLNGNLIGGTGSSGNTSTSEKVTVLSAYGTAEVALDQMVITDGNNMKVVTDHLVVQSSSGKAQFGSSNGNGNNNASDQIIGSETVWGDFTVYGKGFGHGVGMSQSGAKGMAKAGYSYIQILEHYYTGATVGQ